MNRIRTSVESHVPNSIAVVSNMALGESDLIPLWFGESDLVTPAFIREAAKKSLDDGNTFYESSRGIPALREAVCDSHKRTIGIDVDFEQISMPGSTFGPVGPEQSDSFARICFVQDPILLAKGLSRIERDSHLAKRAEGASTKNHASVSRASSASRAIPMELSISSRLSNHDTIPP